MMIRLQKASPNSHTMSLRQSGQKYGKKAVDDHRCQTEPKTYNVWKNYDQPEALTTTAKFARFRSISELKTEKRNELTVGVGIGARGSKASPCNSIQVCEIQSRHKSLTSIHHVFHAIVTSNPVHSVRDKTSSEPTGANVAVAENDILELGEHDLRVSWCEKIEEGDIQRNTDESRHMRNQKHPWCDERQMKREGQREGRERKREKERTERERTERERENAAV